MRAPLFALLPTLFLALAGPGLAATWEVNTLADELDVPAGASLSLREAVRDAAQGDTIQFAPSLNGGTIVLTRRTITISSQTVDAMALPNGITVSGNNATLVFTLSGASPVLRGIHITKGSGSLYGGGVNCTGNATLENCSISECRSTWYGSALYSSGKGSLVMRNCAVYSNLIESGSGGGTLHLQPASGITATLINCTVANNEARGGTAGITGGSGTVHLNHCTVVGNHSTSSSAGVAGASFLRLENSVIAGNISYSASATPSIQEFSFIQNFQKVGQNFISSNGGYSAQFPTGPLVGTPSAPLDPALSPLALHGGRTLCMVPVSGSPLLNQGASSAATPATDQRGLGRVSGTKSDLGSVEVHGDYYFPANGAVDVTFKPTLAWSLASAATSYTVMFGPSPGSLSPVGTSSKGIFNLPELAPGSTYYWRIDSTTAGITTIGTVISFTTRTPLVVTKTEDEPASDVYSIPGVSLREALTTANASPGLDLIHFAPELAGQQVVLSTTPLEITSELRIEGQSIQGGMTIKGSSYRVLSATEFNHLTILDGTSTSSAHGVIDISAAFSAKNCTITGGRAVRGAGIYLRTGSCTLVHCTLTENLANTEGGGIYRNGGTLTLENSIVAGNRALESAPDIRSIMVTTQLGKNLIGNNNGAGIAAGPLVGTSAAPISPVLAPVGLYTSGGATHCPPLPGSPAIAQAVALPTTPGLDQIGQARPGNGSADLGAVEYSSSLPLTVPGNGEQETVTRPALFWNLPGTSFEVFFGTAPGGLSSLGVTTKGSFQLPELAENTTYHWRIDSTSGGVTTTGTVYSFTTRGKIVVSTLLDEDDATPAAGTGISFREAVSLANTRPGFDRIGFASPLSGGTMALTIPTAIFLSSEITLDASDLPDRLTLDRGTTTLLIPQSGLILIRSLNITSSSTSDSNSALNSAGALTLQDLAIHGISAKTVGTLSNSGRFVAERCSISNNQSVSGIGTIRQIDGISRLTNCTLSGNLAGSTGAINVEGGQAVLIHCTISGNRASYYGGIYLSSSSLGVVLENCIVAGNQDLATLSSALNDSARPDIGGYSGAVTTRGKNLIGVNAGFETLFPPGPLAGTLASPLDPGLLPDASYIGHTATRPLKPGSPAINAAQPGANSPGTDQRGIARSIGAAPDLGAFESQAGESYFYPLSPSTQLGHRETLHWIFQPGADLYRVLLGPIGSPLVEVGTTTGSALTVTLEPGTSYQWQIIASSGEASDASPILTFSTRTSIVVTTLEDESDPSPTDGTGLSLREAIALAASIPGTDYIVLSEALSGQVLNLTKGELVLNSDLEIDGTLSDGRLAIDASRLSRAFDIDHWQRDIEIRNLTIENGLSSDYGGAIANDGGLRLHQVDISNCASALNGGAIWSSYTGRLDLESCNLISNRAGSTGSGISDDGLRLGARQTTVAYGKGADLEGNYGQTALESINVELTNCTVANNLGTGISAKNVSLVHTTITGNRSEENTSGVSWSGTLTLKNSIIAGNMTEANVNPDLRRNGEGASLPIVGGTNLVGSNHQLESSFPTGPLAGTINSPLDPLLLHLGNYGGATLTTPPHGRSAARRAAGSIANSPLADQRGVARSEGITPDLGSADFSNIMEAFYPQDGSEEVSVRPRLKWIFQTDASTYEVFFGSSPATMTSFGSTASSVFEIPELQPLQTYFWKLVATVNGTLVESAIQSFTTREPMEVRHSGDPVALQATGLSLRQAAEIAEKSEGFDCIVLDSTSALLSEGITLAQGPIHLVGEVSLLGIGDIVGISGDRKVPVIRIWPLSDCRLENLDIHDGLSSNVSPGVNSSRSKLSLHRCVLRDNRIRTDEYGSFYGKFFGGGIYGYRCDIELDSCLITGNQCYTSGGAGSFFFGTANIRNCTISGNFARESGGGIYFPTGSFKIENSTVTANTSARGGGIANYTSLELANSIIAGNQATSSTDPTRGDDIYLSGTIIASGNNLIGNNNTVSSKFPAGPRVGTPAAPLDPKLSPLGNHGGSLASHLPLPGSPAIDAAISLPGSPVIDQRGLPRPLGAASDLGAIEAFPIGASIVDTDGDGMDDRLESIFGFTVGLADGSLDADGDGSSNADELGNRSNPHDPSDLLRVSGFQTLAPASGSTGPTMRVSWPSFPGLNYTIELSENLDFDSATSREINAGTADGFTESLDVPLLPGRDFIRVRRD